MVARRRASGAEGKFRVPPPTQPDAARVVARIEIRLGGELVVEPMRAERVDDLLEHFGQVQGELDLVLVRRLELQLPLGNSPQPLVGPPDLLLVLSDLPLQCLHLLPLLGAALLRPVELRLGTVEIGLGALALLGKLVQLSCDVAVGAVRVARRLLVLIALLSFDDKVDPLDLLFSFVDPPLDPFGVAPGLRVLPLEVVELRLRLGTRGLGFRLFVLEAFHRLADVLEVLQDLSQRRRVGEGRLRGAKNRGSEQQTERRGDFHGAISFKNATVACRR
jgi:hypothetical protein